MKKAILFLVALLAMSANVLAQGQTATLQQGDKMTPFYGPDAFVQAYNAAQKGAIITLSAGTFNTVDSIMKEVTVIGNGYRENKTVLKERNFEAYKRGDNILPISLIIGVDNVKIEGLDMNCVMIRNTNHLTIRHCKIYNLWGIYSGGASIPASRHKNTIIDKCLIGTDLATSGENYCIKNSIISGFIFANEGDATNTLIINCLFGHPNSKGNTGAFPHAVYKNCIIGTCFDNSENEVYDNSTEYGYEFYNNVFFAGLNWNNDKGKVDGRFNIVLTKNGDTSWQTPVFNWTESQTCKGNTAASYNAVFGDSDDENPLLAPIITTITGDDNKVVGPYGGTGFSWNPSIPRIVDSKIDSYTDAEGMLKVSVKVEVNN